MMPIEILLETKRESYVIERAFCASGVVLVAFLVKWTLAAAPILELVETGEEILQLSSILIEVGALTLDQMIFRLSLYSLLQRESRSCFSEPSFILSITNCYRHCLIIKFQETDASDGSWMIWLVSSCFLVSHRGRCFYYFYSPLKAKLRQRRRKGHRVLGMGPPAPKVAKYLAKEISKFSHDGLVQRHAKKYSDSQTIISSFDWEKALFTLSNWKPNI